MKLKSMKIFQDKILIGAFFLVLGCLFLVLFAPYVFSQLDMGISFKDTGQIGDTIGGITAPFIGLTSAVLVFLGFYVQYDFNRKQEKRIDKLESTEQARFLAAEIQEFARFFRDFVYDRPEDKKYKGCQAWVLVTNDLWEHQKFDHWQSHDYSGSLEYFQIKWENLLREIWSMEQEFKKPLLWKLVTEMTILNAYFESIKGKLNEANEEDLRRQLKKIDDTRSKMIGHWRSIQVGQVLED
jgi:hypothetical protein